MFSKNNQTWSYQTKKNFWSSEGKLIGKQSQMTKPRKPVNRKLTDDQVIEILKLLSQGKSYSVISKLFYVSENIIYSIRKNKTYCNVDRSILNNNIDFTAENKLEELGL